ncbi:phage tail assembly protein [Paenibacillus sp. GCM10012307]|uniref:Phage tail assembly protein n=1 Tax=Paenibacillus roseus TaxID=2798579 RepID=A0A934MVG5_9BACL|nr:phage tail assembly protein [Paenibacillus roseus]MBJ6362097.1 phage tail assembly protein [Paenibacillus roseus]
MAKYTLKKPVEFEGQTIESINLDFDSVTGDDMIAIERRFLAAGNGHEFLVVKEFNKEYQIQFAARASKLPLEFFKLVSAFDFSRITVQVGNFFMNGVSVPEELETE